MNLSRRNRKYCLIFSAQHPGAGYSGFLAPLGIRRFPDVFFGLRGYWTTSRDAA